MVVGGAILRRFPELIPLVSIIGGALAMGGCFIGYSLCTKPDIRIMKSITVAPHEEVQPTESRKLYTRTKENYQAIPELEELRKEIGSYYTK